MNLRYAFLCDYAASGNMGKPTVVGIYTALFARKDEPIRTSPCFIHSMIEAPAVAGPRHIINHRLIDADGTTVFEDENPITFTPETINPESQFAFAYVFAPPINLPGVGDYEWVIQIDGVRIGSVPFSIAYLPDSFTIQRNSDAP